MGSKSLQIAIAGGTGMVGQALSRHFLEQGHRVLIISRHSLPDGIIWNPAKGTIDVDSMQGTNVVINLAGESIAEGRWTDARKKLLIDSRLLATGLLAKTITGMDPKPELFVSASAMGIYGSQGESQLTEGAPLANDFLARLAKDWEAAAEPASAAGIRVVHPRFGIILTPEAGALSKLLPPARLGLGGPIGDGQQWWSWINLSDLVLLVEFLVDHQDIRGPVNVVTPHPVRQKDFARILGEVLHRPAFAPMPAFVLRLALGEMADAALIASTRLVPGVALASGFAWRYPELPDALRAML